MPNEPLVPVAQLPRGEFAFPGPLRDALVAAILSGAKTSTTSLEAEYPDDEDPRDLLGTLEAVVDSHGTVVCVIRTTEVRVCRLAEVDDAHAIAEGEGYADAGEWRAGHEQFWRSPEFVADTGIAHIDDDTLVVCQKFGVDKRYPTATLWPWDA